MTDLVFDQESMKERSNDSMCLDLDCTLLVPLRAQN